MGGHGGSEGAGESDTVAAALTRAVSQRADATFFEIDGKPSTFGELDRRATRFANELTALGLTKGDRLVTMCETGADAMTAWFATAKLGAVWVPVNLAYRREFLRHQICDAGARIAVCDRAYLERIVEIADQLPDLKLLLCAGDADDLPECAIPIRPLDRHRGSNDVPPGVEVGPADLAMLIYTSGTTGPSKGCMLSHNYVCMWGRQQRRAIGLEPGVATFAPLPLFHAASLTALMGGLIAQTRVCLSSKFSVSSFWDEVERSGASRLFIMATMFPLLAHAPDTPAMKRCHGQIQVMMGVPCPPDIRRIFERRFGVEHVLPAMYGQTEVQRLTMTPLGQEAPDFSIGRPADEHEVAILDEEDRPVPPNTVGEICCRPKHPNVMFEGYWNRPEETRRAWRNLWMHTGDLGRMDEDGFVYFVDRAKDYLRSRGENISSFEVEQTFLSHPAVLEAALHAASAELREDDVKITVVLKPEAVVTERELCLWAIDHLPYFAVPRYFEFRDELIKNPIGRVMKYRLREEGVTPATWDREATDVTVRRRAATPNLQEVGENDRGD